MHSLATPARSCAPPPEKAPSQLARTEHASRPCAGDGDANAAWAEAGQTLERALLDLRRPAFSHGHAYVAISRVQVAEALGVFVNETCCVTSADGTRCAVLTSVVYSELLGTGTVRTDVCSPCAIEPDAARAPPTTVQRKGKRARMADMFSQLDDAAAARRMRAN